MITNIAAVGASRAGATLAVAVALLGCQSRIVRERSPPAGGWTAVDSGARDVPAARDAVSPDVAPSRDAAPGATSPGGKRDGAVDAIGAARDGAGRSLVARDASAPDVGQDSRPRDATTSDSGPALCGPRRFNCTPYACDVDAGQCETFCTSDIDCVSGKPCVNGLCGPNTDAVCQLDDECASGHCAAGACCSTACAGACHSCALTGAAGSCSPVPAGMPDPQHLCPAGTVCGADAGCVPASDAGGISS